VSDTPAATMAGGRLVCVMVDGSCTQRANPTPRENLMTAIVIMLVLGLLVAGAVVVYVAYPHRGEEMPVVPQLGDAMRRGVDSLPTLEDSESRV
jgi:hypothetical protein